MLKFLDRKSIPIADIKSSVLDNLRLSVFVGLPNLEYSYSPNLKSMMN
jgi:hypothetical protein